MRNVEIPIRSERWSILGVKLTVKNAELLSGVGRIKKRRLLAERQQEMITEQIGPKAEIPTPKGG